MTARKTKTTPADVVPDAPTIAEHDAEAVATELEVRAAPGATLEARVVELERIGAGPLILELTCDGTADLGYFELPDGAVAARVYIDAGADPLELEPFLAALGAPFTSCGRTAAPSVPAELADAWGRRYARAARIEE